MGGGASNVKKIRYIGGKTLSDYFTEIIWSEQKDLLENLGFDNKTAFLVFVTFAAMDRDRRGELESETVIKWVGSYSTKFTKRVFYLNETEGSDYSKPYLDFRDVFIMVWAFCSLDTKGLARYAFEIFDVDNRWVLEKPDLETMFKLLYNTEEHDETYIAKYPYSGEERQIHKDDFIDHSARKKKLVQPVIDYRDRLRNCMGGKKLWEMLTNYRRKKFHHYDWRADTLYLAVKNIVASDDPYKRKERLSAAEALEENKRKVALEAQLLSDELANRENQKAEDERQALLKAEDRSMRQAFDEFSKYKNELGTMEFTTDSYWDRHDCKQKLYELIDVYMGEHHAYWEWKEKRDWELAVGTDEDHEYRYQDHLKLPEGKAMKKLMCYVCAWRLIVQSVEKDKEAREAKRIKKGRAVSIDEKLPDRQVVTETYAPQLETFLERMLDNTGSVYAMRQRQEKLLAKTYGEDVKQAKKYSSKANWAEAEEMSHQMLLNLLRDRLLSKLKLDQQAARETRIINLINLEADAAARFGSRISGWELVLDVSEDKMVYINKYMEEGAKAEIRHPKTAFCEKCDTIYIQHEMYCGDCGWARSQANLGLFRPLGSKDITLDL